MSSGKKNPLLKLSIVIILIGVMISLYSVMTTPAPEKECTSACEKPAQSAPLPCTANTDCEVRGKDEWETCQHKQEPVSELQQAMVSRDQTSKTQEGYSCLCVESQCKYHKP
ncbi:MAG: hypothetical protein ACAH80_03610 [Alphaproteobacteria bacterium]